VAAERTLVSAMAARVARRYGLPRIWEGPRLAQAGGAAPWPKLPPSRDPSLLRAGPRHGRRPPLKRVALIAIGLLLFLAISGALARFLATENVERDDDLALIQAQAKGDAKGMLADLSGCRERPSCVALVRANAGRLRRAGAVKILSLKSSTAYSLTGSTGTTRLAWTVIGMQPVVQCIEVRRTGSVFEGITVSLRSISAPIGNEADC
jgi:hypothetical protein